MPERLRRILLDSGLELSRLELLDALWLATQLPDASQIAQQAPEHPRELVDTARDPADQRGEPRRLFPSESGAEGVEDLEPRTTPRRRTLALPAPRRARGTGVHSDPASPAERGRAAPALPVRAPEGKALTDSLSLSRALRPLRGHRASPVRVEVDEAATVTAMAETGLADVVISPARERWLDLALVIDDGVSMLLWQRLCAELRCLLEGLGCFRDVRVHGLHTRSPGKPALHARPFTNSPAAVKPTTLTDPSGTTMVVVLSDGIGAAWRDGRMAEVLALWGRSGPTAIMQVLPPELWGGSAIAADRWEVTSHAKAAPNSAWRVTAPALPPALATFHGRPVPVLAPRAASVAEWAQLVASSGGTAVLPLMRTGRTGRREAADDAVGQDTSPASHGDDPVDSALASVLRFRDSVSPEAYRLAAHLAAVTPMSVPAMRLVQESVPWPSETSHLAEVFAGGLMQPAATTSRADLPVRLHQFDFHEEAKAVLLDAVPTGELLHTGVAVGRRMDELVGRSPDFPAWLRHPSGTARLPEHARAFAWVGKSLLERLGITGNTSAEVPIGRADFAGERDRSAVPSDSPSGEADTTDENAAAPWPGIGPRATVLDIDESIEDLVRKSLHGEPEAAQTLPTFLYVGPGGSGKTTLLNRLEDVGQSSAALVARVDVTALPPTACMPVGVLLDLTSRLSRGAALAMPPGFPTFLGVLACYVVAEAHELDEGFEANMDASLRGDRRTQSADQLIGTTLGSALADTDAALPLHLRLNSILRSTHVSAETLLTSLERVVRERACGKQKALELIFRAFLSDLRTAYRQDSTDSHRPLHCLLLLDNVDCPAGERLLSLLTRARPIGAQGSTEVDPLLTIATARRPPRHIGMARDDTIDVQFAQWWFDSFGTIGPRNDLVSGQLPGLSVDEVVERAERLLHRLPANTVRPPVPDPSAWLGKMLYDLTLGHPGAVTTMLGAFEMFAPHTDWAHRLRTLCTPGGQPPHTYAALLDFLAGDVSAADRSVLIRAAAVHDLDQALATGRLWESLGHDGTERLVRLRNDAPFTVPGPRKYSRQLHPLLRHLLLRGLASRRQTHPYSWRNVHDGLRRDAHNRGDGATAAYHSLALGDVPSSAAFLHQRLTTLDPVKWLEEFELVRQAPPHSYALAVDHSPRDVYERLVHDITGDDCYSAVARALVACWLAPDAPSSGTRTTGTRADPLADPYGQLVPDAVSACSLLMSLHPTAQYLYQEVIARYAIG
ncbi:SAV_2336 N-terminal domain-related protein [Streptomyces sp. NPDC058989]|uniref:SAV_2336 N-terminal domain-related protein n=1 Tax=Streptomyces sp. NPDC058989 TaxID=3346686 RepID=UPI0036AC459C